jgi:photosystem II stability/assembly factor-like uncharacterized protein
MADHLLVATRKGLFTIERRGKVRTSWGIARTAFLGDNVSMVLPPDATGHAFAALDHGHFGPKLHRSTDGGRRWKESGTPAMPPPAAGEEEWREPMGGNLIPQHVVRIWSLERGRFGALWCGTIPGGLFRSSDDGASWEFVRTLWDRPERKEWFGGGAFYPGIHSICINPRDDRQITIAVSCGGVWHTTDGGVSWENRAHGMRADFMPPERQRDPNIQDPHRIAHCPAQPDALWAQHHNGVFRTKDSGRAWTEITSVKPSVFGFALAVHPADAETAWLVPAQKDEFRIPVNARVVVARTRDGGASFDVLTRGLPQRNAYDLTYRHALDVDETGERLAFGTTTGSLWVSENGGDEWKTVSEHLPPVYAVRWAAASG